MKLSKLLGFLILTVFTTGFAFSDANALKMESVVVETFDAPGSSTHADGSPIIWQAIGSKFSTEGFPRMQFVSNEWPDNLHGPRPDNPEELGVLGLNTRFDRQGYNQVELVPGVGEGENWKPKAIELPGQVTSLDLWVWGSNYDYSMEIYFMDYKGQTYRQDLLVADNVRLPVGSLKFSGWRNMYVELPSSIPQSESYNTPTSSSLRLVKLVIHTSPLERVDNFYVYLDHIKVLTNLFESYYDGFELTTRERTEEIWGSGDNSQGGGAAPAAGGGE